MYSMDTLTVTNPRIPEFQSVGYGIEAYNTATRFVGQYERGNEVFTDASFEDIQTFDFVILKKVQTDLNLTLLYKIYLIVEFEIVQVMEQAVLIFT